MYIITWINQFSCLFAKSFKIFYRKWTSSIYFLIFPILSTVVTYLITTIGSTTLQPKLVKADFYNCNIYNAINLKTGQYCNFVGLFYNEDHKFDGLVNYTSSYMNKNEISNTIFENKTTALEYLFNNPGKLRNLVEFISNTKYNLYYNDTTNIGDAFNHVEEGYERNGVSSITLKLTATIDSAIMSYSSGKEISINPSLMKMNSFTDSNDDSAYSKDYTIYVMACGLVLCCGMILNLSVYMNYILYEKENELLKTLRMIGLYESAYWISYFILSVILSALIALITIALGFICNMDVFKYVDFSVLFITYFLTMLMFFSYGSFFCSFINKSSRLNFVLIGLLIFTVSFNAGAYGFFTMFYNGNFGLKIVLVIFPSYHYITLIYNFMTVIHSGGSAKSLNQFHWSDLGLQEFKKVELVVSSDILLFEFLISLILLVFTWYISQSLDNSQGARKGLFFMFKRSYWDRNANNNQQVNEGDTLAKLQKQSNDERSIIIHKLSKSFGTVRALKEVSQVFENGKCTALLGQNGSGKTTLISILSGQLNLTFGNSFINGCDIRTQVSQIQSMIGICPQFDRLWDVLTAEEHIRLMCIFHRIPLNELTFTSSKILSDVNLSNERNHYATTFSGGMKRRLSLGLALVGNPSIIFLDEPTTGMDPVSRRMIWDLIERTKNNKIILLTTHSMEEADVLGDKICVLSDGRVRASGTPLYLKNHFGSGYLIRITCSKEYVKELNVIVKRHFVGASVVYDKMGTLEISIPTNLLLHLSDFLKDLNETYKDIKEWGISSTTLEDVFMKLISKDKSINEEGNKENKEMVCPLCNRHQPDFVTLFTSNGIGVGVADLVCQYCAEGRSIEVGGDGNGVPDQDINNKKNEEDLTNQKSTSHKAMNITNSVVKQSHITCTSQVAAILYKNIHIQFKSKKSNCCVIFVFLILVLVSALVGAKKNNETSCIGRGHSYYCYLDEFINEFDRVSSCSSHKYNTYYGKYEYQWSKIKEALSASSGYPNYTECYDNNAVKILIDTSAVKDSIDSWNFSGIVDDNLDGEYTDTEYKVDFKYSNDVLGDNIVGINDIKSEVNCDTINRFCPIITKHYTAGGLKFEKIQQSSNRIDFDYSIYRKISTQMTISSSDTNCYRGYSYDSKSIYSICDSLLYINMMDNGLASHYNLLDDEEDDDVIIVNYFAFPNLDYIPLYDPEGGKLQSVFSILTMLMLMSPGLSIIVEELNGRLLPQMKLHGLNFSTYVIGNAIYCFIYPFISCILLLILNTIVGSIAYDSANYLWMFLTYFLWSYCQVCIIFFIASIIRSKAVSKIICLIIFITPPVVTNVMEFETEYPLILQLLPPFAFAHIVTGFLAYGSDVINGDFQISQCFYWMFIISTILLIIGLMIIMIHDYSTLPTCSKEKVYSELVDKEGITTVDIDDDMDEDVKQLNDSVMKGVEKDDLIYIKNLKKIFKSRGSTKTAVKDLCLKVKENEIFGLLGPNGAGKTTSLEILCGLQQRTSGEIMIDNHLVNGISDVRELVGVCTQFDVLWNDLTIKEHLEFYSLLKGVSLKMIKSVITSAAESLNLDGDVFYLCPGALSGGNKRRLSLAISLLGNPKLILLDEPTTGLDPENRRFIWDVIKDIKESGISIVLTTHSMEEADALCSEIGIMVNGSLQCIGTHQHLKNKYGSGYKLKVLSPNEEWDKVDNIIMKNVCPTAAVVRTSGKTRTYQLNCENNDITSVFEKLHEVKDDAIREWSMNQSSLEEVFIKLCQDE